jgi:hypothetical protein
MRRPILFAVGLILASACTSDADPLVTTTVSAPTTVQPEPLDPSELPGRLVVLDQTGNVITVDPDGSAITSITDDAGEAARYGQPSWSPQADRLVWAEVTAAGSGIVLGDPGGGEKVSVSMGAPPFYMSWSPDGRGIGVLHNGAQGVIDFELVDVEAGTTEVVGSGSPFYFSWSPDSDQVVVHVERDIFGTIDLDGTGSDLGATGSDYPAPHWTPAGIFHLGTTGLEVRDLTGDPRILATTTGPVALVANDQGTRVAVQVITPTDQGGVTAALSETPALPTNAVAVIDVVSGELSEVTDDPSIGFFWSPDGESLLILEPVPGLAEIDLLVWRDGDTRTLSRLAPQPGFVQEVLQFFDQYSQSLELWSPDSSAVVLAGAVGGEQGIWIHDVGGAAPFKVLDGTWAVWSNN